MHLLPGFTHLGHGGDSGDMIPLFHAHGAAGLGHGDVDPVLLKAFYECHCRCAAAVVDGGAGPVEGDQGNLAGVSAGIGELHDLFLVYLVLPVN